MSEANVGEIEKRLAEPVPDGWERISKRQGPRGEFRYLKISHLLVGLNEVFGALGWSHTVTTYRVEHTEEVRKKKKSQRPGGKDVDLHGFSACASACVELVVGPPEKPIARHSDVGSSTSEMQSSLCVAVENAVKAAASDALKRAARGLGARLGLAFQFEEDEAAELGLTGEADEVEESRRNGRAEKNDQAEVLGAAAEDHEDLAAFGPKLRQAILESDPPSRDALVAVNQFLLASFGKKGLVKAAWTSVGVEFEDGKPTKTISLKRYKALSAYLKGAERANGTRMAKAGRED